MSNTLLKTNNHNSNINRILKDEAIENAGSFEEARAIIVYRLNHLREDLLYRPAAEDPIVAEICKAREDGTKSLMDIYAGYYSPCKVSEPTFIPKGQGDMNDIMISFSEGFSEFIESLEEQYVDLIIRRRRATILLNRMLSIRLPWARLMYMYYYQRIDPGDVTDKLFCSRATFYRLKADAISAITKMYYPGKVRKIRASNIDSSEESA
jgi:hypothetical protein